VPAVNLYSTNVDQVLSWHKVVQLCWGKWVFQCVQGELLALRTVENTAIEISVSEIPITMKRKEETLDSGELI